jgi:hypothetical protein
MGPLSKSGDPDQSGRAQLVALQGAAPLSNPEAARTAVLAALNGLVEAGLATWREQTWHEQTWHEQTWHEQTWHEHTRHEQATPIELHGPGGETWLLDHMGVTRVR